MAFLSHKKNLLYDFGRSNIENIVKNLINIKDKNWNIILKFFLILIFCNYKLFKS